jgi:hypothetical protein
LRPKSEEKLFAELEKYMAADDRFNAERTGVALLDRFPDGAHASQAQQYLDSMEMEKAERRLLADLEHGRKPETEGSRLYAEAWGYEQFGDHVTALEKYQSIVNLMKGKDEERPYVNLAKRQVNSLMSQSSGAQDRAKFIESRLKDAEEQYDEGETLEAHKIWNSIVTLYGDNRELRPLVERAQKRLSSDDSEDSKTAAETKQADKAQTAAKEQPTETPRAPAAPPQPQVVPKTAKQPASLPRVPGRRRPTLTREMVQERSNPQTGSEVDE